MHEHGGECPGSKGANFSMPAQEKDRDRSPSFRASAGPVQMHLVSRWPHIFIRVTYYWPLIALHMLGKIFMAPGLRGNRIAIACPKLDEGKEVYLEKLVALIDKALINTLTVMTMEVPCCAGLLRLAQEAAAQASRKIPIKSVVVELRAIF